MKLTKFIIVLLYLFSIATIAQNKQQQISELKEKIDATTNGEKLVWMDSLAKTVEYEREGLYDSIANKTLIYSIAIDSMKIAADKIGDLIYFYNAYMGDYDKSFGIYDSYKSNFSNISPEDVTRVYLNSSNVFQDVGNNEVALKLLDSASKYAKISNNRFRGGLATMYRAQIYSSLGKTAEASKLYKEVITVFEEEKDTFNILATKNSLSILYSQNNFFEEASLLQDEAIAIAKIAHQDGFLASLYSNKSTDLGKQDSLAASIKYAKLAIDAMLKTGYKERYAPPLYAELIIKYSKTDSLKKADEIFEILEEYKDFIVEGPVLRSHYDALKHYYFAKGDYKNALNYGLITLNDNNVEFIAEESIKNEKFLADVYNKLGNTVLELKHLKKYQKINDSINSVKKINALSYYQTLYETEKRDNTIKDQEKDLVLLEEKNTIKNQYLLFGGLSLLGFFALIMVLRSRNNYKKQQMLQQKFTKDILENQEKERTRVAKELHDSVGQQLSLITKKAQNNEHSELAKMTANALEEVRAISRGLYPPMLQKIGLTKSISQMLYDIDEETSLFVSSEIDTLDPYFDEDSSLNIFRLVQEGVANVLKHSGASTLEVKISEEKDSITLLIRDNGQGFSYKQNEPLQSLGLKTMQERATLLNSVLRIKSILTKGTEIQAQIKKQC